jgi:hypothetical protein
MPDLFGVNRKHISILVVCRPEAFSLCPLILYQHHSFAMGGDDHSKNGQAKFVLLKRFIRLFLLSLVRSNDSKAPLDKVDHLRRSLSVRV